MQYLRSATKGRSCLLLLHSFFAESKVCQYYVSLKKNKEKRENLACSTLSREKTGSLKVCLSINSHVGFSSPLLICLPSIHPIVQVLEPVEKNEVKISSSFLLVYS